MSTPPADRRKTLLPSYEQPYEALFDQTNDAVVILDPEGIYVAVNKRAADMLGYTRDELVGLPMSGVVKSDEYANSVNVMAELLAGRTVSLYERTLIRKDGAEILTEINASLVRDDQQRPAYFQVVARDITRRRRQEEALRLIAEGTASGVGAEFFQAVVQHLAQALDVRCAFVTERLESSPGRARLMARWPSDDGGRPAEYDTRGTPSAHVFEGNLVFESSGVCGKYPDDRALAAFDAEGYLGLPLRDPAGDVIGHLAVLDDKPMNNDFQHQVVLQIFASRTGSELARCRADDKREVSEIRYRTLVEQLPAITYVASLDLDIPALYISPQLETILGFSPREFCVRPSRWRRQVHPDDRKTTFEALEQSVADGTPFRAEYRIYRKDGSIAWIRDEAAIVRGTDGAPLFLQGIVLDITVEKRLADELLNARKLESVGILAGGIAHDFNNSLMGILGNVSMAKNLSAENPAILGRLLEAEKAAVRARGLTQQLLTFAKGGAPVRKPTSIEGVIRDTVQFVLSGSNVRGDVKVAKDLWTVDVDAGQISQVIENLALNAVQAMPDGGLVEVEAVNSDEPRKSGSPRNSERYVCIRVRDEGVGIRPEVVDRIFDPYFTTKKDGMGLGLATSYAVVQKHDGYLGVRARPQGGTEFTLCLPACEEVEQPQTDRDSAKDVQGAWILVMDDDEIVRNAIRAMLAGLGHSGEFVANGDDAISAYRTAMERGRPFDAVILDLTISGGYGGEETMRRLLRIDPDAVGIVSSGYSESKVMAETRRFGFRDGIAKPYRPDELAAVLNRVLGSA